MRLKLGGLIFLLLQISSGSSGQDCNNYEKRCPDPHKSFKLSATSRSFAFKKGSKTIIAFNAMGGRDYFISVCGQGKVEDVQFKIISGENENKKTLYDNSAKGFSPQKIISMSSTQKIFIEVTSPKTKLEKDDRECGGIKIAYRNTP